MAVAAELLDAAIEASRQARATLAEAANGLQGDAMPDEVAALGAELSRAVGGLYAVEARDADTVLGSLRDAMANLRSVLTSLQQLRSPPPEVDRVTPMVARTLATLHPTCSELERHLEPEPEPAIPLAKPKPKRKPTLELVGDDAPHPPPQGEPPEPPPTADDERRAAPRAQIEVGIGFQSDSNFYTGFSGDVSDGGLFVATVDTLPVGTELLVSFWIPDGTQVTTRGRVAWVREPLEPDPDTRPGMGIRFVDLTDAQRLAIERFVQAREPLFHAD